MSSIFDGIMNIVDIVLSAILSFLPGDPFMPFIQGVSSLPYLGWFNWFIPVGSCIGVGAAWLLAIAIYYLYQIILRWIKATGE